MKTDPTQAQAEGEELAKAIARFHGRQPPHSDEWQLARYLLLKGWLRRAPPAAAGEEPEWGRGVRLQSLTSEGLEPCPSCGHSSAWLRRWMQGDARRWVRCMNCKTQGPTTCDDEEAKAAWNALPRRALLPPPAAEGGLVEALKAMLAAFDPWECKTVKQEDAVQSARAALAAHARQDHVGERAGLIPALERAHRAYERYGQRGAMRTARLSDGAVLAIIEAANGRQGHASDCAVHNAPALLVGPCDCGADPVQAGEGVGNLIAGADYPAPQDPRP